jgi:trimethylamine:corrinoid methyltransferase-like protein
MKYAKYRPLVGNGVDRDTSIYVGVQTLENSGIDRRVDLILTEAGMEFSMPECHAVWKQG